MDFQLYFTRDDGKTFAIDKNSFGCIEAKGFDAAEREIFTEKRAIGHGEVVTGERMKGRDITVKARSLHHQGNRERRETVRLFFNFDHRYDITLNYNGTTASARECVLKAIKQPTDNLYMPQELEITLYTQIPYLQSGGLNGENINRVSPTFGFPFYGAMYDDSTFSPTRLMSTAYGVLEFNKTIDFYNDGVCSTWMKAVMTARGGVDNPKLVHNNKYIRIKKHLSTGDVLEIDTEKRTVKLNGKNASKYVDTKSSFAGMELKVGKNTIGFDADSGDNMLDVQMYYYKLVEGI